MRSVQFLLPFFFPSRSSCRCRFADTFVLFHSNCYQNKSLLCLPPILMPFDEPHHSFSALSAAATFSLLRFEGLSGIIYI